MILNTKSGMIVSGKVGTVNAPKETASGKRYMTFSIAGAYENKETTWVNCKAWNDMVDIAVLLAKGDCAIVTGRVEEREYNGKQYKDLIADCIIGMNHGAMDAREPDGPEPTGPSYSDTPDELPF
jgi:single-stranded DNA-binding protein